jgi:hypothetical protein
MAAKRRVTTEIAMVAPTAKLRSRLPEVSAETVGSPSKIAAGGEVAMVTCRGVVLWRFRRPNSWFMHQF